MKRICLIGITALLTVSAHGQHPGLSAIDSNPGLSRTSPVTNPPEATIQAPTTNAIPLTAGGSGAPSNAITITTEGASYSAVPQARPGAARLVVDGLHEAADTTLGVVDATVEGGKLLGVESDEVLDQFVENAGEVVDSAGHVLGAYDAYREEGAEGMLMYGIQEGGEHVLDSVAERLAGPAAPAWRLGRFTGDLIKENVRINGQTIESHVTGFYFNLLEGRAVDRAFELNTSDGAIELHRQRMRRAGIFSGVQNANEQAAANRAAIAAQGSGTSDNAAFMNDMMLTIMPAVISASQQPTIRPPFAAPQPVQNPFSVPAGSAPGGRSLPLVSPPLGSTFGSPSSQTQTERVCRKRPACYSATPRPGGNAECQVCLDPS